MTHETVDPAGTEQLGAALARQLRPGDVVLLTGDLGVGKTTLVRGAAGALGVTAPVTSPTFTIANRYPTTAGEIRAVSHLDLYRLGDLASEDPDLLADYVASDTVAFIEWPGEGESLIAEYGHVRFRVHLAHAGEDRRSIVIEAP